MSAPNVVAVTTITGKTAVLAAIPITATSFIVNAIASGTVLKVNALYVSNVSPASASITADIYRASAAYRLAFTILIPVGQTLDILSKSIYVEEGDTLRLTAGTASALEAVGSYEIISS